MAKKKTELTEKPEKYAESLALVRAKKIGRPTTYNQEIVDYILWEMTENGTDLANACKKIKFPKSLSIIGQQLMLILVQH